MYALERWGNKILSQCTKSEDRGCLLDTLFDCTKVIFYHALITDNQNILTEEDYSDYFFSDPYLEHLI